MAVYFSGTCPLCKITYRDLYYAVTSGKLKGKALLVAKPFNANPVNNALMAAHGMGKFNDFMLELAKRNTRIDENLMLGIANDMKLDTAKFKKAMEDPALVKRVELANKEAVKNEVTHVPTFFISGQRYKSVLDSRWIVDAVEYIHETKR
jgi:predicted DsbA family dithiol-disulfide isomerase